MHIYNTQSSQMSLSTIGFLNQQVVHTKQALTGAFNEFKLSADNSFETTELMFAPEIDSATNPWKYKINQYGYRGAAWDFKKSPAVFGDSTVFGIGVLTPAAEILQRNYQDTVIPNLGIPGGSVVNIIKSFAAFAHLHPISHAFITLPALDRFFYTRQLDESQTACSITNIFSTWPHIYLKPKIKDNFFEVWLNGPNVSYALDYVDWAQQIALTHDIKLFWTTWEVKETAPLLQAAVGSSYFEYPQLDHTDSRDKAHPGVRNHTQLANQYWNLVNQW